MIFGICQNWILLMKRSDSARIVQFDQNPLHIEDIIAIAKKSVRVILSENTQFRSHIAAGTEFLDQVLREDGIIYGVTTGYGDSCTVAVPADLIVELPHHLYTYHGCGLGEYFNPEQTRAIL